MRITWTALGMTGLLGAVVTAACGGGSSGAPGDTATDGGVDAAGPDATHPGTDAAPGSDSAPATDAHAEARADADSSTPEPEGGPPTSGTWSMGYYAGYQSTMYPVADVDWAGLTHIAVAFYLPAADGTLDSSLFLDPTSGPALAHSIVQAAHAHGVKAIASIGGAGSGAALQGATSAGTMGKFVTALVGILSTYGYDGLDIDWEPLQTSDQAAAIALANQVRAAHPGALMTMPVGYENGNSPDNLSGYPAIAAVYDQVNIMSYGMAGAYSGWKSWHSGALHYTDSATPTSIDDSVGLYLKAGVPAAKLGFGIGFYGLCYTAPVTAPDQALGGATVAASDNDMSYANIMASYYSATTHQWDALALVPYLSLPGGAGPKKCTFVSYDDPQSIAEKGKYLKAKGLGGVIEWTINQGAVGTANPLLDAVQSDILQMKALFAAGVAALSIACSSSSPADLCGKLASGDGCSGDASSQCTSAISDQKQQTPDCAALLDALTGCLAGLSLSCTSDGIAANGSGSSGGDLNGGGPDNFTSVGSKNVVVNGGCDDEKRGYDACTTCATAPGATQAGVRGIGEGCTGSECASGLECTDGECTRPCSSDSDCEARSKNCQLLVQFPNTCATVGGARRCTRSCAFDDTSTCQYFLGTNYSCTSDTSMATQACVPQ